MKSRETKVQVKKRIIERKKKQLQSIRKMVKDFSQLRLLLAHPFFEELKEKKSYFKTPIKPPKKNPKIDYHWDKENRPNRLNISNDRNTLITSAEIAKGTPTKLPKKTIVKPHSQPQPHPLLKLPFTSRRINLKQRREILQIILKSHL